MDNGSQFDRARFFDDALALGIEKLKAGAFDDAARLYDALSGFAPDDPNVLHYSGVLAHHQGRSEQAIELIRKKPGGRRRPSRLLQQSRHHLQRDAPDRRRHRRV